MSLLLGSSNVLARRPGCLGNGFCSLGRKPRQVLPARGGRARSFITAAGDRPELPASEEGTNELPFAVPPVSGVYAKATGPSYQDALWSPSMAMQRYMRILCDDLGLNMDKQVAGLKTQQLYSAKLDELKARRAAVKGASPNMVTDKQSAFLMSLGAQEEDIRGLTRADASALIEELMERRNSNTGPPTQPQLALLQKLGYMGPTPPNVTEARALIAQLIRAERIEKFRRESAAQGYTPSQIAVMEAEVLVKGMFD